MLRVVALPSTPGMIDSSPETALPEAVTGSAKARWVSVQPPQVHADEAVLNYVNGQMYLAFGQIQVPAASPSEALETIDIQTVSRVVLSEAAFHKILAMFNRVAARID